MIICFFCGKVVKTKSQIRVDYLSSFNALITALKNFKSPVFCSKKCMRRGKNVHIRKR